MYTVYIARLYHTTYKTLLVVPLIPKLWFT